MSENLDKLNAKLHDNLNAIGDHVDDLKADVGSTNADMKKKFQARLDKLKINNEEHKVEIKAAEKRVKDNMEEKKAETDGKVAEWKHNREVKKLEKRAQRAEDHAVDVILLAFSAIEESDYAITDAIISRIEADDAA